MQKLEPRFYPLACARVGVRPEGMPFRDNVEVCVTAARAFGVQAILFRDTAIAVCLAADE